MQYIVSTLRYTGTMSPKDRAINLRVSSEWLAATDEAAERLTASLPAATVSRNALIEHAVIALMTEQGWDDLAARAKG